MPDYPNDSVPLVPAKGEAAGHDMSDQEKWLIYCPAIASDTLLYYIKQGDSYSLRSYGGHLGVNTAQRHAQGAHTSVEFERLYRPEFVGEMSHVMTAVSKKDRWTAIVAERWKSYREHNLG